MFNRITCGALIWLVMAAAPALGGGQIPTVDVCHPIVIAFFKPAEHGKEKEADYNEALSDFQLYAGEVQQPLKNKGINFKVVYAPEFRTQCGRRMKTFTPKKITVGYYFVEQGKKPQVEYGVITDMDLLKIADEYFRPY